MRSRVLASLVFLVCGLPISALAGQWSKSYPVSGRPELFVSTGDGDVRLDVWDQPRIEARIDTVGYEIDKDFRLIESQAGNRVSIETKFRTFGFGVHVGRRSLTLTLKVPREATLDLHTGDGDMTITGAKGDIRLRTGDGTIDARQLDGRVTASSGDGNIGIDGRFDLLDLHSGDGDVEATVRSGSDVMAGWTVRTGDGSVTMRLPADLRANIDAHTNDGHVTFDMPVTMSGPVNRSRFRGTLNGGGGTLTVHTGDGSIHVARGDR